MLLLIRKKKVHIALLERFLPVPSHKLSNGTSYFGCAQVISHFHSQIVSHAVPAARIRSHDQLHDVINIYVKCVLYGRTRGLMQSQLTNGQWRQYSKLHSLCAHTMFHSTDFKINQLLKIKSKHHLFVIHIV